MPNTSGIAFKPCCEASPDEEMLGLDDAITSGRYWALLGFDLARRARNAVWRPPFVMYYRVCPLHAVSNDLTASGFSVTTMPLTALGL